jgi:transcriptional regulator with XRE-family HTH domain
MDFEEHVQGQMQHAEYGAQFAEMAPDLQIALEVTTLRTRLGLSQSELAARVGTRQASISRLENGMGNPGLDLLKRVARALGVQLTVRFEPATAQRAAFSYAFEAPLEQKRVAEESEPAQPDV